jgi:hypothetical protein
MAWDPPNDNDVAAKGRHAAHIYRYLIRRSGRGWQERSPAERLQPLHDVIDEMASFLGHPELEVGLADERERQGLAQEGRSVGFVAGASLSAVYDEAYYDAESKVLNALTGHGVDPELFDLSRAMDRLPHVDKLIVDPGALEGGPDRIPVVMETVVQRLTEHTNDPALAQRAQAWGAAYAGALADEMGVDYLHLDAERASSVVIPPIVTAGLDSNPQLSAEASQAFENQPAAAVHGARAMSDLTAGLNDPKGPAWEEMTTEQRLYMLRDGIDMASRSLQHPPFEVEAATRDEQLLLRDSRQVAEMVPADVSQSRYNWAFDASKERLLEELEAQGVARDRIDPGQITPDHVPTQKMVVDTENLAGDLRQVPTVLGAATEAIAQDMGAPSEQAREMGVAYAQGAALEADVQWTPVKFGNENLIDLSALSEIEREGPDGPDEGPGGPTGPDTEGPQGPHPLGSGPHGPSPIDQGGGGAARPVEEERPLQRPRGDDLQGPGDVGGAEKEVDVVELDPDMDDIDVEMDGGFGL